MEEVQWANLFCDNRMLYCFFLASVPTLEPEQVKDMDLPDTADTDQISVPAGGDSGAPVWITDKDSNARSKPRVPVHDRSQSFISRLAPS